VYPSPGLLITYFSTDDISPGKESPGPGGSSGGQEDPASQQWGKYGVGSLCVLGTGQCCAPGIFT
jgi:hypothetical protein